MKQVLWAALLGGAIVGCKSTESLAPAVNGCTDPLAGNYNPRATKDNGTCTYDNVQTDFFCKHQDLARLELGMTKNTVRGVLGVYPWEIYGAEDGCEVHVYRVKNAQQVVAAQNWERNQAYPTSDYVYHAEAEEVHLFFKANGLTSILSPRAASGLAEDLACIANDMASLCGVNASGISYIGCTNKQAKNYNPGATHDDGTCVFAKGCTDPDASNFSSAALTDDGSCVYIGCGDPAAINFNPDALHNQALCEFCPCDTQEYFYVRSSNPGCDDECIKVKRSSETAEQFKPQCTWCQLIDQAGPASIQIGLNGVDMD